MYTVPSSATVIPEKVEKSICMSSGASVFAGVAITGDPEAARMSGPLPSTKTRKLFTPGEIAAPVVAASANPFGIGSAPDTPGEGDEQRSNAPEVSAKLII